MTFTPAQLTEIDFNTRQAYIDNQGNTIAIVKRDALPTGEADLEKRAVKAGKPSAYNGLSKSDLNAACMCLNLVATTYTRNAKATTTGKFLAFALHYYADMPVSHSCQGYDLHAQESGRSSYSFEYRHIDC
jgi:hypothetical protein